MEAGTDAPAVLLDAVRSVGEDAAGALKLAEEHAPGVPLPGNGSTRHRWAFLAAVAEVSVTAARVFEAHLDALAILAEAGNPRPAGAWGVFAAEGPYVRLDAVETAGAFRLTGTKPWCSLAGLLDSGLVTANVPGGRRLFSVDLRQAGVHVQSSEGWISRGLRSVPSGPVSFEGALAHPIGPVDWYLTRPGFAWGGIGVAACWHGAATGFLPSLRRRATTGDQLAAYHLGAADVALHASRSVLDASAVAIDGGAAQGIQGQILALRVRSVVADAVEQVLTHVAHALGPAPLAFDEAHAARVADLGLYVRQHHAERDLAALGQQVAGRFG